MGWPVLDYAPAAAGRLFLAIAQNGGLAGLGWAGWAGLAGHGHALLFFWLGLSLAVSLSL